MTCVFIDGGMGTIYIDNNEKDAVGLTPEAHLNLEGCGGSEDGSCRERGCWDELMEDGELFDNDDPWLTTGIKNG